MTTPSWEASADLVVIGTGVAGLTAALHAQRRALRVVVITKSAIDDGNTRWAQGGIAVVLPDQHDHNDSLSRHIQDTMVAGAGLCELDAAFSRQVQERSNAYAASAPSSTPPTRGSSLKQGKADILPSESCMQAATRPAPRCNERSYELPETRDCLSLSTTS